MRSVQIVLENARYAASLAEARHYLGDEPFWWGSLAEGRHALSHLSAGNDDTSRCLSKLWSPRSFWVPSFTPKGFPLICVSSAALASKYCSLLRSFDLDVEIASDLRALAARLFRGICVYVVADTFSSPFYAFESDAPPEELVSWLRNPYDLGCPHSDAYTKFRASRIFRTEDVWGELGAWPWGDLEKALGEIEVKERVIDPELWARMWHELDAGRASRALFWADSLWNRERRFRQRHYFDLCSLYIVVHGVWSKEGAGDLFRLIAEQILHEMLVAGMSYERMYFTCFWLWTTQYWSSLCQYVLKTRLLHATAAQWTAICKETTAVVTQTWMFPLTNRQHIASAYFLNAEDLNGFSDADAMKGEVTVEVLKYALNEFKYTYPSIEGRTFDAYLQELLSAATSLLEPIYKTYADKAKTWDEFISLRSAWAAGGVAGRRSRDVLGNQVSPPGAAKAYVMTMTEKQQWAMDWGKLYIEIAGKLDERGVDRTLSATDMRDQTAESYVFHPLRSRYPVVGLDIGESPAETMGRHINLIAASEGPAHYLSDGRILVAWDWSKWDHYVHVAEHMVVLKAMRQLIRRYIRQEVATDMLREIDRIEEGHRVAIFRCQAYADDHYSRVVDEIIKGSGGRARRVGDTAVEVTNPAGQQSGRRTTLEVNTIIGTSRLLVRDSELLGRGASLRSRTSMYVLNRADDVAEVFRKYQEGKAAVEKMLEQGHLANPKKQVAQWRSIVYFRILYAGGAMRPFPPRAVYAAASGHPNKGSGGELDAISKLRSISSGLEMWARRGGWLGMARALYDDAERFFSKTRVWTRACHLNPKHPPDVVRLSPALLHAAPENGGAGILPVGVYEYDYRIKAGRGKYELDAQYWRKLADDYANAHGRGPGLVDLEANASSWVARATGVTPTARDSLEFQRKWAAGRAQQDGEGIMITWLRNAAICDAVRTTHVDKSSSGHKFDWESWSVRACLLRFKQALQRARRAIGAAEVTETIRDIRGPPAYGMFKSQYYGYASIIYRNSGKDPGVLRSLAGGSALGRDYLAQSGPFPDWLKVMHLEGKLGAAGAWHKLLPPSWAGWLDATVSKALFETCLRLPNVRASKYQVLMTRSRVTSFAVQMFRHAFPHLFLH
ncbi:RNA dependent RNA polymerase [Aspergillus foetidus dsRNA mycovirus]|uniref:RNA-directed RNA polymerase n=1 Tax=Aspergillus foetidus dsRNA mycovirus TaxID=1087068 RepID=I7HUH0_9VIRU|nr:RNA dependent RNA polymerase [Aspergillus foetidus dsRNA mycovirus]CCD33020.1 RNA dependent RNA polymerase [Aspergillus foetidus dsRNA mycovirus]